MNIFKTLASGSGSINEPNVSAFLGYLLNPKEDHGLGDAFLKKFLEPLLENNDNLKYMKGRNLSIRSNFEIEVLLEQAFKTKEKQIVDIVILCYEKEFQQGLFLAESIIQQKKEGVGNPEHIFLIENKIKDEALTVGQLGKQYGKTIDKLIEMKIGNPQELVSVIYVTPNDNKYSTEFDSYKEISNKCHLFWSRNGAGDSTSSKNDTSISKIIKDILNENYPPIDAYCKYTLQAFLEFIEGDFKSTIKEELEEKKRENPRFEYKGEKYSRPKLAERIICDYIKNNSKITFQGLSDLFPEKMDKAYPPFVKAEEAQDNGRWTKNNKDNGKYFNYYNNPIQIADATICVRRGWYDETELQELLDIAGVGQKLDDMRIK